MPCILIRGANEFGSAFAHRLWGAGYDVVIHEAPRPADCHRAMAYTDAVYDGSATLSGLAAWRVETETEAAGLFASRAALPLLTLPLAEVLAALRPGVLIDARMRKRARPEEQRRLAALTVGLGPGFAAGENVDLAVETGFGADFGQVYERGRARDLEGEPPPVEGIGRERFVYAPVEGTFATACAIGMQVQQGEQVGTLAGRPVPAPVTGALRGLSHDGAWVEAGVRVVEVDPRGPEAITWGVGTRQGRLVDACWEALLPRLRDAAGG